MSNRDGLSDARRKANELLNQKEIERLSERDKARQAQDAKILRLRELRLAKEAQEKATASQPKRTKPAREPL
jgi:membrane protein involved in colicin uptake